MSDKINTISIVSRASSLATIQAKIVGDRIKEILPDISIRYHTTKTDADINININISDPSEIGIFTKDISTRVIDGECDLAVHSWKDLPIEPSSKTEIIGTLGRGDMRDVIIMKSNTASLDFKKEIKLLTSSPRRRFNLGQILPTLIPVKFKNINFIDIRGNIQTRLKKFQSGNEDAIILAKVALDRLIEFGNEDIKKYIKSVLSENKWSILPLSIFPTAPGQGAIAIEAKKDNKRLKDIIQKINSYDSFKNVQKEKLTLSKYGGGCHQKIGTSVWDENGIKLISLVGMTHDSKLLKNFALNKPYDKTAKLNKNNRLYPMKNDEKLFKRKAIDNSAKIKNIKNSLIYLSRKNVLDKIEYIDNSNILWTSGISCWKNAVSRGYWIHGSSDSFGERGNINIENFLSKNSPRYKLSHDKSSSDNYELIPVYELNVKKSIIKNLNLNDKTHFFWMSPLQFDLALDFFPEIINGNHSCGFGRTYDHIKAKVPSGGKVKRFHSYTSWFEFYNGE